MVRILTGAAAGAVSSFRMPSMADLKKLEGIVLSKLGLSVPTDESEHERYSTLQNAFWGVGQLGRLEGIETRNIKSATWWCSELRELLNNSSYSDIGTSMFCLVVRMHNDIDHSIGPRYPHDLSFGLTIGTGRRATDAWRQLLDGAPLRRPSVIPMPEQPRGPSQVIVNGGF